MDIKELEQRCDEGEQLFYCDWDGATTIRGVWNPYQAWEHIFGEKFDDSKIIKKIDGPDNTYIIMPDNIVILLDTEIETITRLKS